MAGHSHAANIAVRKGKQDRLRAKVFSKLSKNIMIAARDGGDPNFNFALRHAVEAARAQSMPNDKIDHAIKKGSGQIEGQRVQEVLFEAYAQGGVALLIECVTDNINRTRPEVNNILEKGGGKMGAPNSVQYMFKRRGLLTVPAEKIGEDKLMEIVLEAGAEDMTREGECYEVLTAPESFEAVRKALEAKGIEPPVAELRYIADNEIELDEESARKVLTLADKIDDHDDVNKVHTNLKYTDAVLALLNEA